MLVKWGIKQFWPLLFSEMQLSWDSLQFNKNIWKKKFRLQIILAVGDGLSQSYTN